jgi:hypothetical protein
MQSRHLKIVVALSAQRSYNRRRPSANGAKLFQGSARLDTVG